jgi:serine/threonine protein kinase
MSSEYAMHGHYSEKSDVFSFGVIIIEIISAKRNALSIGSPVFDDVLSYVSMLNLIQLISPFFFCIFHPLYYTAKMKHKCTYI